MRQLDPRELSALITSVVQQAAAGPRAALRRTCTQLHNEGREYLLPGDVVRVRKEVR